MTDLVLSPDFPLILALAFIGVTLAATPLLERRHKARGEGRPARRAMYRDTIILLWSLAVAGLAGWVLSGRPLADIGFAPVRGDWRGLAAWALTGFAVAFCAWQVLQTFVSRAARSSVRSQLAQIELTEIRPRNGGEALHFQAVSVTAGVTEEIVFRGVLIAAFALIMPLWAAVILSLIAFVLPHAYQGWNGLVRVAPTGAFLTVFVLLGGSLWPAVLAHALIDMTAGATFWLLDRFEASDALDRDAAGALPESVGPSG